MLRRVVGLVMITRPLIVASILFTPGATAFLAVDGIPLPGRTLLGMVVAVTAIAGAHVFNDYCDRRLDALNDRTRGRPLVREWIRPRVALLYAIVLLSLSATVSYLINATCFGILGVGLVLIVLYSAKLKRTLLGFLLPAFGAALLPLGAWAVYRPETTFSLIPLCIAAVGFCFELQPYWCQSILDRDGDQRWGADTLLTRYGTRCIARMMLASYVLSFAGLIFLYLISELDILYLSVVLLFGIGVLIGFLDFGRHPRPEKAKWLFVFSMGYITLVSMAIMLETTIRSVLRYLAYVRS